jgi:hypothetical protein
MRSKSVIYNLTKNVGSVRWKFKLDKVSVNETMKVQMKHMWRKCKEGSFNMTKLD